MLCAVLGVLMKNNGCSNKHQFFRGVSSFGAEAVDRAGWAASWPTRL